MKACRRAAPAQPSAMRVTLTVELAPGVRSDMLICMILNGMLAELTSAGLDANHIGIDIAGYRPDHIE